MVSGSNIDSSLKQVGKDLTLTPKSSKKKKGDKLRSTTTSQIDNENPE
jgi:hypothetical protein